MKSLGRGLSLPLASVSDGAIPSDHKFRLVVLTCQRAKQLKNGAKPRVDTEGSKHLRVAMLEVMAGMVSWSVLDDQRAGTIPAL